jgi:hypothetical protein
VTEQLQLFSSSISSIHFVSIRDIGNSGGHTAAAPSTALATTTTTATTATTDDDNTAFMRALPASLRQAILFDMDHSQISALPDDLATEARTLQQQHREREIDLFAHAAAHRSEMFSNKRYLKFYFMSFINNLSEEKSSP